MNDKPRGIIPPAQWPVWLQNRGPKLVGLFVGGCVDRGVGSSFRATAHAHTADPNKGWICVRGWRRLGERNLMLHELAHILSGHGHDDKWRETMRDLGAYVEARHQKQTRSQRKPCECGSHRYGNAGATFYYSDPVFEFHSWAECRKRKAAYNKVTR